MSHLLPAPHSIFDHETFTNSVNGLAPWSKEFYGQWILELTRGRTLYNLNWSWKSYSQLPNDFDTYVFSHHVETWDHIALSDFCEKHPNQMVVIIADYPVSEWYAKHKNLKFLVQHFSSFIIKKVLAATESVFIPMSRRSHRMSILVNKPSFYKTLATAYLRKYHPDADIIMSWNTASKERGICPSMGFLNRDGVPADNQLLQELVDYYHTHLKNLTMRLDNFVDSRFTNYFWDIPAFTDCVIHLTAETFHQSVANGKILPGPFVTDKSWKTLLSGIAFLPQGSFGHYAYFEKFGFQFDYPWDRSFDDITGDYSRLLALFEIVDQILEMDMDFLRERLAPSTEFNFYHVRSQEFFNRVENANQDNLAEFLKTY